MGAAKDRGTLLLKIRGETVDVARDLDLFRNGRFCTPRTMDSTTVIRKLLKQLQWKIASADCVCAAGLKLAQALSTCSPWNRGRSSESEAECLRDLAAAAQEILHLNRSEALRDDPGAVMTDLALA